MQGTDLSEGFLETMQGTDLNEGFLEASSHDSEAQ